MTYMKAIIPVCTALALALPGAAIAKDGHKNKGNKHGASVHYVQGCPPGLAKKNNGCLPPGQAKKVYREHYDDRDRDRYVDRDRYRDRDRYVERDRYRDRDDSRYVYPDRYDRYYDYRIGDYVRGNYVIVDAPGRYGLDPNATYYNMNNQIYQVNRETQQILAVIGLAQRILN